ncbi:uncharacterized protein LOC110839654 isoform X2 [Zootermopsis nevadensis]|uniref:uncharacterized protein LOC110839654 isoform X2 n=1 Tax=Zootermopsis nevadensis TaxID=136037 RepID=UPI000B8E8047|nr:uncharacterized protein LOC110839654 isoform X2 [Zootermopsis nevadensis]
MSDSDDTDVLLLIPPDFFLVHSDSEDSLVPEVQEGYRKSYEFEKLVVNDLISQVNELENRICVIENKSSVDLTRNVWGTSYLHQFYDCAAYPYSNTYQHLRYKDLTLKSQSILSTQHRLSGSTDNLRTHVAVNSGINSSLKTPVKQKQAFSLPSTPNIDTSTFHFSSHSEQVQGSSLPEKNAITVKPMTQNEILSMSYPLVGNIATSSGDTTTGVMQHSNNSDRQNQLYQDCTLIEEIDQFLDSVKKNSEFQTQTVNDCNKRENSYNCGEYSASVPDHGFGLRDFSNLPVREEIVKSKYIAPLETGEITPVKQAELNEVDLILREAENDFKDGKHPNLNPIHKPSYQQKKIYRCGNNVTSVPDLGFGVRSFNSLPVQEEEVKRKTVLPLGPYQVDTEMKGLELSDLEKLLKQIKATQHEVEKKLQLRESLTDESSTLSEKDSVPAPLKTSLSGENFCSVPDRGFEARGILNSSKYVPAQNAVTSENGTEVPVHEESIMKRNVNLLGAEVPSNKAQWPQVHGSIEQHTDKQNFYISDVETFGETKGAQQIASNYPTEPGDSTKIAVARRKLVLGGDASSIPDCGFGLKSWYNSDENKDGYSESVLNSHKISNYVHDGVIPLHPSDGESTVSSTVKNSYIQGDYLPSVPDLGFGLQKLWINSASSQGLERNMTIPKSFHAPTQTHIDHIQTNNDLHAAEYSSSQIRPRVTVDGAGCQWVGSQKTIISTQGQSNSVTGIGRGSSVTDTVAKKKVDFSVGSGQGDVTIMQQEQGAESNIAEGLRNKPDHGNVFLESGVSGMTASVSSGTSNLVSLSELWSKDGSSSASRVRNEHANIWVRYEEEKYRRHHCERLIQQLQISVLEEEQKLAVAVQVDRGKDKAILQLQDAWIRLVQHWKELEEQRHSLTSRLHSERKEHQRQESEMMQLKQLESELSKALDLAQGYKVKFDNIEKDKLELIDRHSGEIKEVMGKIVEKEQKLDKANQLNCQLIQQKEDSLEKLKQVEQEAQKERKLLIDVQREVECAYKKLNSFEAEVSALKEERETLKLKLKEEKGRINILDQQKKSVQATLDENKKKEKTIREEMKQLTVQSDKMKTELREYYQEQLEVVVHDKLREFQEQLDAAETSLHKELEQREHAITEMASKQIRQISEKHRLEMQLLEEKHVEELQLYKLQLAQAMQQVSDLEAKLQGYNSRKSEMVDKLHCVMETQWQEALRIIIGNSPLANHVADSLIVQRKDMSKTDAGTWPLETHNQQTTLDRNDPLTLKSHYGNEHHVGKNNTVSGASGEASKSNKMGTDTAPVFRDFVGASESHITPLNLHQQSSGSSTAYEMPFNQNGLLTYRKAEQPVSLHETPLGKGHQEDELRKYIIKLLDRSPGNPTDDGKQATIHRPDEIPRQDGCSQDDKRHELVDVPTNEVAQHSTWEKILHDTRLSLAGGQYQSTPSIPAHDLSKARHGSARDRRCMKPAWK